MAFLVGVLVLHSLLITTILVAGGLIPWDEIQFTALASIYLVFLSRIAFPPVSATRPPSAFAGSKILKWYVSLGAVVGLLLPICRIVILGRSASPAVPHTALLLFQIVSETIAGRTSAASFPIRAFVPIAYNSRRLFTIWAWMGAETADPWAAGIAIANMAFWSFNLFCFLLPCFLPIALRHHYRQETKNN